MQERDRRKRREVLVTVPMVVRYETEQGLEDAMRELSGLEIVEVETGYWATQRQRRFGNDVPVMIKIAL